MIVNIFSPECRVFEAFPIQSLSVMASIGCVQILPGHAPFIGELGVGPFSILDQEGQWIKGAISYGYIEVCADESIVVYAETIELASVIDKERAQKAYHKALYVLNHESLDDHDFLKHQKKLIRSLARLDAGH